MPNGLLTNTDALIAVTHNEIIHDDTLSGKGTTTEPLGACLENVTHDESITETSADNTIVFGVNPDWVNYVVTAASTSGYATTGDLYTTSSYLSGAIDYVSANAGGLTSVKTGTNITGDGTEASPIGMAHPFSFGGGGTTTTWSRSGMFVEDGHTRTMFDINGVKFSGTNSFITSSDISIGTNNKVSGVAVAVGNSNSAYDNSYAFGDRLVAKDNLFAIGTYNKTSSDALFVIGNGYPNIGIRKDVLVVDNSGNVFANEGQLMNTNALNGLTSRGYSGFSGIPWYIGNRSMTFSIPGGVAGINIGTPNNPGYNSDGTWKYVTEITITKPTNTVQSTAYISANGTDVYPISNGQWIRLFAATDADGLVWVHDSTNFSGTWTRG